MRHASVTRHHHSPPLLTMTHDHDEQERHYHYHRRLLRYRWMDNIMLGDNIFSVIAVFEFLFS